MLSIQNLNFSYKRKSVLKDLSLHIKKGTSVGIVGANGCGKSTLLSILSGTLSPASGSYYLENTDVMKHPKIITEHIGYVPQENPLIPELTVKDNLSLWYSGTSYSLSEDLQKGILSLLSISDYLHTPVHKLSGGMKKRISIAIALASHPDLLVLDEPSAALDLVCKHDIHTYLSAYLKQGGTILLTSHEESELELCQFLYVLKQGDLHAIPPTLRGKELLSQLTDY